MAVLHSTEPTQAAAANGSGGQQYALGRPRPDGSSAPIPAVRGPLFELRESTRTGPSAFAAASALDARGRGKTRHARRVTRWFSVGEVEMAVDRLARAA